MRTARAGAKPLMDTDLALHCRIGIEGDSLVIAGRVENHTDTEIFLTNHAVRRESSGRQVPDRSATLVFYESDATVHVSQRRAAPPPGLVQPRPHFVTPVPPDSATEFRLALPLPLRATTDYVPLPPADPKAKTEKRHTVRFSIGYLLGSPFTCATKAVFQGEEVSSIGFREGVDRQAIGILDTTERFLACEPVRVTVPCVREALAP